MSFQGPIGTYVGGVARDQTVLLGGPDTGSLTIPDWRQNLLVGDAVWLISDDGSAFDLAWTLAGRQGLRPLVLPGVPAGRWRLVNADGIADWSALANGSFASLRTIKEFSVEGGKNTVVELGTGK